MAQLNKISYRLSLVPAPSGLRRRDSLPCVNSESTRGKSVEGYTKYDIKANLSIPVTHLADVGQKDLYASPARIAAASEDYWPRNAGDFLGEDHVKHILKLFRIEENREQFERRVIDVVLIICLGDEFRPFMW